MESPEKAKAKQAGASSEQAYDRALDRPINEGAPLKPGEIPPPPALRLPGEGNLHLQHAHYSTLEVDEVPANGDSSTASGEVHGWSSAAPGEVHDRSKAPDGELSRNDHAGQRAVRGSSGSSPSEPNAHAADEHRGTEFDRFGMPSHERADIKAKFVDVTPEVELKSKPAVRVHAVAVEQAPPSAEVDVNDAPSDIALSNAVVAENAPGAVVGVLSTMDADIGDSHTYTVSDSRFEVVAGQLKLKDGVSLDYESEPNLGVTIASTDASGASFSETFVVTVSNVNESPSDIALSSTVIAENAAGVVVGTLSTTDVDAGDSHSYTVSDSRFEVVDGQLKLKDGVSLDHEVEPSVSVTVTSTDASGASFSESFNLTVSNLNESPSDIGLSNTTIAENASGAIVGTLSTTDVDAGDSHTYTVSDNRFEVVDGQLKLKDGVSLDHEDTPSLSVTVTSTDASGASLNETFNLTVYNVNEGPSDIGLSNTTIAENAAGAVVGTLSTSDVDAGDSHSYTVSDNRFEVVDGQLKLKDGVSLDHEGTPTLSVTVTSTDASGASLNETFNLTVSNVNEGPSDIGLSNATVAENASGAVVGTLSTSDVDAGDSHTYTVSDNRFEVVGGQLKLRGSVSLNHETEPSVSVTVTSADASGASLSETFNLTVANVNEAPNNISLSNATIAENAAGAVVGTLSTADVDAGDSHTYTVSDSRFEVLGGQLKLKAGIALDHEVEPSVSVTVTARDQAGATHSKGFSIGVQDVDEAPAKKIGTEKRDTFIGGDGADDYDGLEGNDWIRGNGGDDRLAGGDGNDSVDGGAGNDLIEGGAGNDKLEGGTGNDTFLYTAGDGNDHVVGGSGKDTLTLRSATNDGDDGGEKGHDDDDHDDDDDDDHDDDDDRDDDDRDDRNGNGGEGGHDFDRGGEGSHGDGAHADCNSGWVEVVSSGSAHDLEQGDWLVRLDSGENYLLHGTGGELDFGGAHAGTITSADGGHIQFSELEGINW